MATSSEHPADIGKQTAAAPPAPLPVLLAGVHRHGRHHLDNIRRLSEAGLVRLVGVVDTQPVEAADIAGLASPVVGTDLAEVLRRTQPRITVICTPIHTHAELAITAMQAGSDVLVEKPPASSRAEFERIVRCSDSTGRTCEVGFQDLGSRALPVISRLLKGGAIGDVRGIGGACAWVRPTTYFSRNAWAGRREVDGRPVGDGALTNPFAHATASALRIAGALRRQDVESVEVELYRANAIEADDTSCARIVTTAGIPIAIATTLCAAADHAPYLVVHGRQGRIVLRYKTGELSVDTPRQRWCARYACTDLLENLVHHATTGVDPLVPVAETGAFMELVETVRRAPDPLPITEPDASLLTEAGSSRFVVHGIDDAVREAAETLSTYSEMGVRWASAEGPGRRVVREWAEPSL